ncbi:17.9 kDa class II heat shock protein [Tanacetum coccineum]
MSGLKSGDIKVQVEDDNVLVISGERKREEEEKEGVQYVRMERRIGKFMRKFSLLENANNEKISAVCQDGVLSVIVEKVPPPEPKKPKLIQVQLPFFRVLVRGGVESSQLALLQTYIEGTLLSNMEDRWVWDLNGEGVFRVKDVRILLDEGFLAESLLLLLLCSEKVSSQLVLQFADRLTDIVRLYAAVDNLSWTPIGSYADWLNGSIHQIKTLNNGINASRRKGISNAYVFIFNMSGLKSGDIKVQVEDDNVLVISGERKREEEEKEGVQYVRMERRIGKFMRKFSLLENANNEKISAVCQDGVLSVIVEKVPPPEPKKPKLIQVQVACGN